MSCGRQRVWARAKTGTNNSGVPTYRLRARHESSIHNFGLDAAGTAGTVCGRENALICCISSGTKFSLTHRKINPGVPGKAGIDSISCARVLSRGCEVNVRLCKRLKVKN